MGEGQNRPGRPWSAPKGASVEANALVRMMRGWIDEAGLSVREVQGRLTLEHFESRTVPDLRRLRIQLSGECLSWDLVEAIADVCFPDESGEQGLARVRTARAFWDKADTAPTSVDSDGRPVVSPRELIEEKERTIQVYRDLVRARQAYDASEQGRQQALRIASMLFLVLGQSQAKVAELSRRVDALTGVGVSSGDPARVFRPQLERARGQEVRLSVQLERAVRQRDEAHRIADLAARRVQTLEAYLLDAGQRPPGSDAEVLPAAPSDLVAHEGLGGDRALDQIDEILAQADDALDREQEAVQDAADELGLASDRDASARVHIAGDVHRGLFRTTLNNSYGQRSRMAEGRDPHSDEIVAELRERLALVESDQRSTAVTLQRSLLPQDLEQSDDLRIAAIYQPGRSGARVGGDWYDVIALGACRTAFVIGDVMGGGVHAAAAMGQLRAAVRAYARLDLPPHEVLQLLDGLAAEIVAGQIATCVYAVHDPNEEQLVYASAGHLPVLVRYAGGTVRRALEPAGPPLGTGGWLYSSGTIALGSGSTAVLYTDGLVGWRGNDIDEGVATLERALSRAQGTPAAVCDLLMRALGAEEHHDDDVAVMVLQQPARTGLDAQLFHNAALELLGGFEAAPSARAFARSVLTSWHLPVEQVDLGVLAASELVANALQHGSPPMRLRLRRTDRRLIVEVTDGDDHLPRRHHAGPTDDSGRGIAVIATIGSAWGSRRTPGGGKAVWCELPLHA
ncbi:serine phosphatase RsbU (regulator of sigma subunit)/anti-sigma regulatory factor (Ser/Thr protein kinase) [Streptomyces sp. SPB162]|nr:serine phosphatase RsbU (regulator of sigma subunit)/anti-sigma regulatory factor (Ser/Thr protein kinase) [Streptomyces sp. SPB162]